MSHQQNQQCQPPSKCTPKCTSKCPPQCPALYPASSCCGSSGGSCGSGGGSCCLSHHRPGLFHRCWHQSPDCCECDPSGGSGCCSGSGCCCCCGAMRTTEKKMNAEHKACSNFLLLLLPLPLFPTLGLSCFKLTQGFLHIEFSASLLLPLQK
nr:late cornified envelope protein 2A-like [Loxodonta africana]